MTTAIDIASAIEAKAEACLRNEISVEECSEATKALWARASELCIEDLVQSILDENSDNEFSEACKASGIAL